MLALSCKNFAAGIRALASGVAIVAKEALNQYEIGIGLVFNQASACPVGHLSGTPYR